MKTPAIKSLDRLSLDEALAYLDASEGDELSAAFALATHRNELAGSAEAPDDAEVHHALFLLRRARGLDAPSFDLMRIQPASCATIVREVASFAAASRA